MLPLKRGISAFSRASSSRSVCSARGALGRRFYADDSNENGSRRETYAKLLSAVEDADKKVVNDLLDPPRKAAPNEPPRASPVRVKLPSHRVNPAPPVGGMPKPPIEMPQRSPRGDTEDNLAPASLDLDKSTAQPQDDAAQQASHAFGKDGKQGTTFLTTVHYRLYVMARSKNCIMTLVNENFERIAVISSGLCKFKNAAEGSYEAGYQCAIFMFNAIRKQVELRKEQVKVDIFLNGFGQGRSALLKALTMSEGDGVRLHVHKLIDKTPIKIGGVRLQKARRL